MHKSEFPAKIVTKKLKIHLTPAPLLIPPHPNPSPKEYGLKSLLIGSYSPSPQGEQDGG
jgi:hypothetical protein